MAIAPLNKFITIAVPVAPGEQTVYTAPTGVSSIVLYASVSNVGVNTYPAVTFTHKRKSTASRTSGNTRNIRVIKNAEIPPQDALVIVDGRLVLERSAIIQDSVVIEGVQSGITTITNVEYDNTTGITTITTLSPHQFNVNDEITMSGIAFTCTGYSGGFTTSIFPDPQRSFIIDSIEGSVGTSKTFTTNSGSVDSIVHIYNPAIHVFAGSTENSITVVSGPSVGPFTPSDADYDPVTGILTLTIASHGLSNGNTISIADNSLSFRCSMDYYNHVYTNPRPGDPAYGGTALTISNADTNTFQVNVGASPSGGYVAPLQMELIMSILENSTT